MQSLIIRFCAIIAEPYPNLNHILKHLEKKT